MKLRDYFQTKGGTGTLSCLVLRATAERAECSPNTLYMITMGHKSAGPKLAKRLEVATDGQVTRIELLDNEFDDAGDAPAPDPVAEKAA